MLGNPRGFQEEEEDCLEHHYYSQRRLELELEFLPSFSMRTIRNVDVEVGVSSQPSEIRPGPKSGSVLTCRLDEGNYCSNSRTEKKRDFMHGNQENVNCIQ